MSGCNGIFDLDGPDISLSHSAHHCRAADVQACRGDRFRPPTVYQPRNSGRLRRSACDVCAVRSASPAGRHMSARKFALERCSADRRRKSCWKVGGAVGVGGLHHGAHQAHRWFVMWRRDWPGKLVFCERGVLLRGDARPAQARGWSARRPQLRAKRADFMLAAENRRRAPCLTRQRCRGSTRGWSCWSRRCAGPRRGKSRPREIGRSAACR